MTAGPATASPGDHLLHAVAARLLAKADPNGFPLPESGPPSQPLAAGDEGFGDVIAALQAAGALSPLSPVPGQFAALCGRLHLSGHGIAAPPARDLPEPWLSMLVYYRRGQARPPRPTAAPPRPSRFPNSTGSRSRSSACTTARAAPSCTCTPAAR